MAFHTDGWGLAFKCGDAKITAGAHTWAMKLSQLHRQEGTVRIITYSLPRMDYVREQLGRRPKDILLIAHAKFLAEATAIRMEFPGVRVALNEEVHSKVLLIEPHTVYVSSANFGRSKWHETSIGMHSKEAHDWYVANAFAPLWDKSTEVLPEVDPLLRWGL